MKALILDGTRVGERSFEAVHQGLTQQLEVAGYEVASMTLRHMEINHCVGCFGCWVQTPGECMIDDGARDIASAFIGSDLVVLFTPVTFGGYSSELKKALDRIICLVSPFFARIGGEVHHEPRYSKYPKVLAVGLQQEPDEESGEIFRALVDRNTINFHTPVYAAAVLDSEQSNERVENTLQSAIEALELRV